MMIDNRFFLFSSLFALATSLFWSNSAAAQTFDDGVRTSAMGGAATSVSRDGDAIVNNPAAIVGSGNYSIEAAYKYSYTSNVFSAAVVDSKTNSMIAAGIGYSYMFGTKALDGFSGHDIRFALAVPVIANRLSIGVGGRYTWLNQEIAKTDGTEGKTKVELLNGFTMHAGALVRIVDTLTFGFSAMNLIPQCKKDQCKSFSPMTFSGGLGYSIAGLTLAVDVDFDIDHGKPAIDVGAGAEYLLLEMIPLRIGYRRVEVTKGNWLTTGAGFHSEIVDVDATYQVDLSHDKTHTVLVNLAVKL